MRGLVLKGNFLARLFDRIIDYRNIWEKDRSLMNWEAFFFLDEKIFHFQCCIYSLFLIDFCCFGFPLTGRYLGQAKHKGYSPPESRKSNSKAPKVQSNTTSELSRGHLSKGKTSHCLSIFQGRVICIWIIA